MANGGGMRGALRDFAAGKSDGGGALRRLKAQPNAILQESCLFQVVPNDAAKKAESLKAKYNFLSPPRARVATPLAPKVSTSRMASNMDWSGSGRGDPFAPPPPKVSKLLAPSSSSENLWVEEAKEAKPGDGIPPPALDLHKAHVQVEWDTEGLGLKATLGVGLANQGNTCFLNSVLQVLTHTPPLVEFLWHSHTRCALASQGFCGLCELRSHIQSALIQRRGSSLYESPIVPSRILQRMRCFMKSYMRGRQEDAHELLRYFLDSLQNACLAPFKAQKLDIFSKHTTPIAKIFGGYNRNEITCQMCGAKSTTYDPFMDISLEVKRFQSIEEALKNFTKVEFLSHDNAYKCGQCKRHVRARKQYTIHRPPLILTIQLKRFDHFGKISHNVKFAEKLNIRPFMSEPSGQHVLYRLYAAIVHQGGSTHSGHYYAFVRSTKGAFFCMDDDRVMSASHGVRSVCSSSAYLLFYARAEPPQTATVRPKPRPAASPHAPAQTSPVPTAPSQQPPGPSPFASSKPPVHVVEPLPPPASPLPPSHKPIQMNLKRGLSLSGSNPLGVKPKKEAKEEKKPKLVPYGSEDDSSPSPSPDKSASNSPSHNIFARMATVAAKEEPTPTPTPNSPSRARSISSGDESGIRIKLNLREGRVEHLGGLSETEVALEELRAQTAERESNSNSDDSVQRRRERKRKRREERAVREAVDEKATASQPHQSHSSQSRHKDEEEEDEEEERRRRKKERKRRRREAAAQSSPEDSHRKRSKKKKKKKKRHRRSDSPDSPQSQSRTNGDARKAEEEESEKEEKPAPSTTPSDPEQSRGETRPPKTPADGRRVAMERSFSSEEALATLRSGGGVLDLGGDLRGWDGERRRERGGSHEETPLRRPRSDEEEDHHHHDHSGRQRRGKDRYRRSHSQHRFHNPFQRFQDRRNGSQSQLNPPHSSSHHTRY